MILSDDDNTILPYALDALQKWSEKWLLNLNINKCQVVTFGLLIDLINILFAIAVTKQYH